MKFKMESDGFSADGDFKLSSKNDAFKVGGSYKCRYIVSGDLDKKVNGDIFDRYLAISMREMAKAWLKKEPILTAPLQKLLDEAEAALRKDGKGLTPLKIKELQEKKQKALEAKATTLADTGLTEAFEKAAAESHAAAMAVIGKEAKGVLKSNKAIAFRVIANVSGFTVGVTATVIAAMGVGAIAAGPIGALVGATAALAIAGVAASIKGVKVLSTLVSSSKSMRQDFKGNLKTYEASLVALEKQFDEAIKLSRGLTSKWDNLNLRQAEMKSQVDDLEKSLNAAAPAKKDLEKLEVLRAKLADEAKSLAKLANYNPMELEKELHAAKSIVSNKCQATEMGAALEKTDVWAGRLDQLVGTLGTVLDTINVSKGA